MLLLLLVHQDAIAISILPQEFWFGAIRRISDLSTVNVGACRGQPFTKVYQHWDLHLGRLVLDGMALAGIGSLLWLSSTAPSVPMEKVLIITFISRWSFIWRRVAQNHRWTLMPFSFVGTLTFAIRSTLLCDAYMIITTHCSGFRFIALIFRWSL